MPDIHTHNGYYFNFSLIIGGYDKPISDEDIWDMRPQDKAEVVEPQFEKLWNQEMEACKR